MEQKYWAVYNGEEHGPGTLEEVMRALEVLGVVEDLGGGRYHVYDKDGGPVMALVEIVLVKKRKPLSELVPAIRSESVVVLIADTNLNSHPDGFN